MPNESVISEDGVLGSMVSGYDVTDADRYSRRISNRTSDKIDVSRLDKPGKVTQKIISGTISVRSDFLSLFVESGSSDDLDTLKGGAIGDRVVLMSEQSPNTVTIKDGTGNMYLAGDFAMDSSQDKIELIKAAHDEWHEISRSSNA